MESTQNDAVTDVVDPQNPTQVSTVKMPQNNDENNKNDAPSKWQRLVDFYWENEFVILVVLVILLARAYPPLGAEYLAEEITASWIAVIFIFSEYSTRTWAGS